MPTIYRIGSYRFYFFSHENNEPPHIHIDKDNNSAKFWLNPVELSSNYGFNSKELNYISKIIIEQKEFFIQKWELYFSE